jgi:tRNA (guanine37-N1)-methyltransferase
MSFRASVLTLYPEMFPGPLGASLAGEGLRRGLWSLETHQIRDHGIGRHRNVDDNPAGGGAGMVLRCDVLGSAIDAAVPAEDTRPRLLMSPRGRPLAQTQVREWVAGEGVVIICGRFEGVDERVIEGRGLTEVSIGDYILSGGEMAAMVLLDACVRLIPGVMGKELSGQDESFENGLLEYPHYTRPREWEGRGLPEALLSGDHARIAKWRREQAEAITRERRPDLLRQGENLPQQGMTPTKPVSP